jgi:tetratricopeptide (TPR) repeat protein
MKMLYMAAIMAAFVASSAQADAIVDGKAGLTALDQGSFSAAVRLFTKVLADRHISSDDRELAYLSRGKAYAGLHKKTLAAADFHQALKLKPNDTEASVALAGLTQKQVAVAAAPPSPTSPWGAMATLAGSWWLTSDTAAEEYIGYQWTTPDQVLTFTGMDRSGNQITGRFERDPATGQIAGVQVYKGKTNMLTATPASDGFIVESERKGVKVRETMAVERPGQFQDVSQAFKDGNWTTIRNVTVTKTYPEAIQALGWGKQAQAASGAGDGGAVGNFFKALGGALLNSAATGLANGVQNKVQGAVVGQPQQ